MTKILYFLTAFVLAACAYDSEDKISSQNQQFEERRNQLLKVYRPLEGVYEGKLRIKKSLTSDQPSDVQARFVVSIQEKNAGTDPTGQTSVLPTLQLIFSREDYPGREIALIGRYNSENNTQITATSYMEQVFIDEITSFTGSITPTELKGTIALGNGSTGQVAFYKNTSANATQSSAVSRNEDIIKQYKRIEGVYEGTVIPDTSVPLPIGSPERKSFKMNLHVNVGLSAANQPFIKAFFSREELTGNPDSSNRGILSQEMVGNFRTETVPERIVFSNPSLAAGGGVTQSNQTNTGRAATNDYFLNIEGIFLPPEVGPNGQVTQEARIIANYLSLRNYVGRVELRRIKNFSKDVPIVDKK